MKLYNLKRLLHNLGKIQANKIEEKFHEVRDD